MDAGRVRGRGDVGDRDDRRGRRRGAGLGVVERRARPHDRRGPAARLAERGDAGRSAARVAVRRAHHRRRGDRRRRARAAPESVPRRRRDRRAGARAAGLDAGGRGSALRRGRGVALRAAPARRPDRLADRRDRDCRQRMSPPSSSLSGTSVPLLALAAGCRRRRVRDAGGGDVRRSGADPRRADGRPPRPRRGAGRVSHRRQPGAPAAPPRAGVRDGPGARRGGAAGGARLAVRARPGRRSSPASPCSRRTRSPAPGCARR